MEQVLIEVLKHKHSEVGYLVNGGPNINTAPESIIDAKSYSEVLRNFFQYNLCLSMA